MTSEERAALRLAIDAAKRVNLSPVKDGCKGCGGEYDSVTFGCVKCNERAWGRKRRAA